MRKIGNPAATQMHHLVHQKISVETISEKRKSRQGIEVRPAGTREPFL